ncbi:hypothetical protein BD410DRAFT_785897 [Rickenella mellea]|uniref:Uncharacterized protein n=1 Tax=Rickenella mellea TaxID=50990 RepID=A0A4Y7QC52_9AGAM|nr:hypothetical protein BD410DRAFT_785897 [Rickenella mellea]
MEYDFTTKPDQFPCLLPNITDRDGRREFHRRCYLICYPDQTPETRTVKDNFAVIFAAHAGIQCLMSLDLHTHRHAHDIHHRGHQIAMQMTMTAAEFSAARKMQRELDESDNFAHVDEVIWCDLEGEISECVVVETGVTTHGEFCVLEYGIGRRIRVSADQLQRIRM